MDLQILNPLDIPEWDDLVAEHEDATIFHTSAWARVLSESYGYRPLYFTKIQSGELKALVPMMEIKSFITGKRGVSLPFTDYCPPLLSDDGGLPGIMAEIVAFGRKAEWTRIDLRGVKPGILSGQPAVEYLTHDLALDGSLEDLESRVHESAMRNVRKAVRRGVTVEKRDSLEGIRQYHALNRLTRKRHGIPPQPFSFFANVQKHILSKESGTVFLAYYQGKCIAGAIFFYFKDQVMFKFGASNARYHNLGCNNLVMWKAIKSSVAEPSYSTLNFGRTDLDHAGLRRFKIQWGPTESRVSYYSYNLSSDSFVQEKNMVKDWQKKILRSAPVPILGILGSVMYRHVG